VTGMGHLLRLGWIIYSHNQQLVVAGTYYSSPKAFDEEMMEMEIS
jgi:hypothetical protein